MWALFWDRSRGRRRCPRCWYDMEGVPGKRCPECGRDARRERSLFRTRRQWRWMAVTPVLFVGSAVVGPVRDIWLDGWTAVPTSVLIRLPRYIKRQSLLDEINGRLRDPTSFGGYSGLPRDLPPEWIEAKLSKAQWSRLGSTCVDMFGSTNAGICSWAVIRVAWGLPSPLNHVDLIQAKLIDADLATRVDAADCIMLTAHRYNAEGNYTPGGQVCRTRCQTLIPGLGSV